MPGDYVRLMVNGDVMMSDTPMEYRTNFSFINNAKGKVFIAGLGIGVVLNALREKINNGIITEIIVLEKDQNIINLVAPFFKDLRDKVKIICGDIYTYFPDDVETFDTIYFDIWYSITEANNEVAYLNRRWGQKLKKGSWISHWGKGYRD